MKRRYYFLILILLYFVSIGNAQDSYYWYKGEKISLNKNLQKTYITFEKNIDKVQLGKVLGIRTSLIEDGHMRVSSSLKQYNSIDSLLKWAVVKTHERTINPNNPEITYSAPFYTTEDGVEAGLTNLFYVKLKSLEDYNLLIEMAREQHVEVLGQNKYMPLWFTLSCDKVSSGNALEMANFFYESEKFQASEPDLMTDDSPYCTNDQFFNNQWGLNNTGQHGGSNVFDINYCGARQISTGDQDIIVAVVDRGVELNHPDLPNLHALSFNTETDTSPSQVLGDHGVAVAGIIGANDNNDIGIAGISPDSPIMSISNSLAATPNSRQRRADGINFAVENGASVINNSWGSGVAYQIIDDAIDHALTQGRDGLGCVIVFAAGNENRMVNYPANSNPGILTVGAMSPCGERKNPNSCDGEDWWGSNFGTQLDLVAPGVLIPTTDRQGTAGYNSQTGVAGNYIQNFNGTSSAAPHISGVAALVLSVNPCLSFNQVNNIIESTAQKVGNYSYTNNSDRPNGTWNNEMGYGLVDAFAAVQIAQNMTCPQSDKTSITTNTGDFTLYADGRSTITLLANNNGGCDDDSYEWEWILPQGIVKYGPNKKSVSLMLYPVVRPIGGPPPFRSAGILLGAESPLPYIMGLLAPWPVVNYPNTFDIKLRARKQNCPEAEWATQTFRIETTPGIIPR